MAIVTNANTEIEWPTSVIYTVYTPLAMVEQSCRLAIEAMKLKNQTSQGIDAWLGICGKGTMEPITRLVVVNDGEQQTHQSAQPTAA
tara:strand:+ start:22 stop:282 length:261 start_codon:yes stop_codon:yes gene_type:complete